MKFYYSPLSGNCRRALAAIKFSGRDDVELVPIDFSKGEHKTPEFLAINPNGKIPALLDGDFALWESNAIMQYVSGDSTLWPANKSRYDIARWQFWTVAHFGPAVGSVVFERVFKPLFGMGEGDEPKALEGMKNVERFAAVLDAHLDGRNYLVGDSLTLADFAVGTEFTYAAPAGIDAKRWPNIARWLDTLNKVEAWKASAPPQG